MIMFNLIVTGNILNEHPTNC